jgi:hypothetical protein
LLCDSIVTHSLKQLRQLIFCRKQLLTYLTPSFKGAQKRVTQFVIISCAHIFVVRESTTYGNRLLMKENLDWNGRNLGLDSHEKKNLVKWTREKGGTQHRSGKKNEKIGPNWRCEVSVLGLEAMNKPIIKPAF